VRRVFRITVNVLAALSAILCVATVGLWVQSYSMPRPLVRGSSWLESAGSDVSWRFEDACVRSGAGVLVIETQKGYWTDYRGPMKAKRWHPATDAHEYPPQYSQTPATQRGWFVVHQQILWARGYCHKDVRAVGVRYWGIAALLSVLPITSLARALRRPRARSALTCAVCNYDLRATPTRCPECGFVPVHPAPLNPPAAER
jgi:hypothetical protein